MADVTCPVCNQNFSSYLINQHVDDCLNCEEELMDQEKIQIKLTPDVNLQKSPMKRKIDCNDSRSNNSLAWGCLQPQESKKLKPDDNILLKSKQCPNSPNSAFKITSNALMSKKKSFFNLSTTKSANEGTSSKSSTTNSVVNKDGKKESLSKFDDVFNFKIPLAESMRPKCLSEFIGQQESLGEECFLRRVLLTNSVPPSILFWGPPGSGKTTLAKMIAKHCKENALTKFTLLSATNSGVNDVKKVAEAAKNDMKIFKMKTILFIDEIHRFNKVQQDSLLPYVEDGTLILFGATTENPSFHLNSALLSRVKVIVLEKHSVENIISIINNILQHLGIRCFSDKSEIDKLLPSNDDRPNIWISQKAVKEVSFMCDGDARVAIGSLQLAIQNKLLEAKLNKVNIDHTKIIIDVDCMKEGLKRSCIAYDKNGEEHYNCVSALQKSIRGSDENAALYWMARMLEGGENPCYIARRLVRTAAEDIGLADPLALNQAVSAYQACTFIGMPECDVILAQCAVYLARAPKSIEVYSAYNKVKQSIHQHKGPLPAVPLHLRNSPTKLMKSLDYGKNYIYTPNDPSAKQTFLPGELLDVDFFN